MSILDFLFGKAKKPPKEFSTDRPSSITSPGKLEEDDGLFEIPKLGMFVEYERSPSKEWVICWRDSNEEGTRGGHRDGGKGIYVLYNSICKQVALKGKLERPNSCHVADNGTFSIEDWGFDSDLSGVFYVMSPSGEQLIRRELKANIFNSAISCNGKYAVCQTANSTSEEDGGKMIGFDIEARKQLFSVEPEAGWADCYDLVEETAEFCVKIRDVGIFYYDATGVFQDGQEFTMAKLNSNRFDLMLITAEALLKEPSPHGVDPSVILSSVARARTIGADKDQHWKALALKLQGACHELLGNEGDALLAYDEALLVNPKIGVKRKADALRKKIGK
jgi:hypothetical protein